MYPRSLNEYMTVILLESQAPIDPAEYLIPYFKHKKEEPLTLEIHSGQTRFLDCRLLF
ncbi:hypothetical protein KZX50_03850 [Bacillus infantis]|uniref:hypothetical protein n=1 Tax=Bacillus infantis TaxID=324767 RepID=UPI002003D98A|nr:hypothetical protein [Bacillus infantis]MCK6204592.1 hypothetical protein [Bacillus infantis]